MRSYAYAAALGGLALMTTLIAYQGASLVLNALTTVGSGLALVILFHLIPLSLDALAWRALLRPPGRPAFSHFLKIRWIKESINNLLPVAQVGGRLVAVRLLVRNGLASDIAGASIVLELTVSVLTQVVYTLLGIALLISLTQERQMVGTALGGLLITSLGIAGFIYAQHQGVFAVLADRLARFLDGDRWLSLVGGAKRLDAAVIASYRRPTALGACAVGQLLSWVLGAGEVWLALYFMGQPATLAEAMVIECLGQAVRSAAFGVPGAWGVQEGGYMLVGALFGLSPQTGLAVSLVKRIRELVVGLPGLVAWQAIEGLSLARGRG